MSTPTPEAVRLYADSLCWDAHAGVFPDPRVDLNLLNYWVEHGFNYLSINVGFDVMQWTETLQTLAAYRSWVLSHPDQYQLIEHVSDIDVARKSGKFAISFDIEGMNALNEDINMIAVYHRLGVRQMLFAYNLNNTAAGGCHDADPGLSAFGRDIVAAMNQVGMIVDCSHAGYRTTLDIMEQSSKPVVFSHSNPVSVCPHERNITDEQITACANGDGVVGINGMGIFLGNNVTDNHTIVQHIRYVRDLVGARHIGLGFDYSPGVDIDIGEILRARPDYWPPGNGYDTPAIGHAGPDQVLELVDLLLSEDFSEQDVQGLLGQNFYRVATASW